MMSVEYGRQSGQSSWFIRMTRRGRSGDHGRPARQKEHAVGSKQLVNISGYTHKDEEASSDAISGN